MWKRIGLCLLAVAIWTGSAYAKEWKPPGLISEITNARGPKIAMNASGHAVAVWQASGQVYAAFYDPPPGSGWGAHSKISGEDLPGYLPDVAINKHGAAVAIWNTGSPSGHVCASIYTPPPGSGWGIVEDLNFGSFHGGAPVGAGVIDSNGNAIVTWRQLFPIIPTIYAKRYHHDNGWGEIEIFNDLSTAAKGTPRIELLSADSGNAIVAWYQQDPENLSRNNVYVNRYEGGWIGQERVDSTPLDSFLTGLGVDNSGRAVVAWSDTGTIKSRRLAGGSWEDELIVGDLNYFFAPIAINPLGEAVTLWLSNYYDPVSAAYWDGVSDEWDPVVVIEESSSQVVEPPDLAIQPSDLSLTAVGLWRVNNTDSKIHVSHMDETGNWSTPIDITPNEVVSPQFYDPPQVVMDANGNAMAVWVNNTTKQIRFRRYSD